MKITMHNLNLLHSAITYFVMEPVKEMSRFEESIVFTTSSDRIGFVQRNHVGNYDVWIGDDIVYEMEDELFDIIDGDARTEDLIGFYSMLGSEDTSHYQMKSREFFVIVKNSIEKIILNNDLPVVGNVVIKNNQMLYTENWKIKLNLN